MTLSNLILPLTLSLIVKERLDEAQKLGETSVFLSHHPLIFVHLLQLSQVCLVGADISVNVCPLFLSHARLVQLIFELGDVVTGLPHIELTSLLMREYFGHFENLFLCWNYLYLGDQLFILVS